MHPDALIASLKQELEQCGDDDGRHKEIQAEIDAADGLERPSIVTDTGVLEVLDKDRAYLDGLRQELKEVDAERRAEIEAEIKHVEALLSKRTAPPDTAPAQGAEEDETVDEPSAEEIEQRKQVRGARKGKVERARNAPVPDNPAPADTAPAQGAEED